MSRKKDSESTIILLIITIIVAGVVVAGLLITLDIQKIYTLALILVGGSVLALVIAAAAFPIRALKKREGPHEREIIRETHTVEKKDGRRDPRIIMPDRGGRGQEFFPEMLRAALSDRRRGELTYRETSTGKEGEREIIEADDREWRGRIRGE